MKLNIDNCRTDQPQPWLFCFICKKAKHSYRKATAVCGVNNPTVEVNPFMPMFLLLNVLLFPHIAMSGHITHSDITLRILRTIQSMDNDENCEI